MFSGQPNNSSDTNYDFSKEENAAKWNGVFINSLKKVSNFLDIIKYMYLKFYKIFWHCVTKKIKTDSNNHAYNYNLHIANYS